MPKRRVNTLKKAGSPTNGRRAAPSRKAPPTPRTPINKQELGHFKSLLEGMRDETVREIDALSESVEPELIPLGDTPDEPVGQVQTALMINRQRKLLHSIEAALTRIDQGSYGSCSKCGKPIERGRLEILPDTTKCMKCERGE